MRLDFYLSKIKKKCPRKEFIKKTNVSQCTFWKIENGGDMKLTTAYSIVEASNGEVTLEDLFEGITKKD